MRLFGNHEPFKHGWSFNGWLRRGFGLGLDYSYFNGLREHEVCVTFGPFLFSVHYVLRHGKRG